MKYLKTTIVAFVLGCCTAAGAGATGFSGIPVQGDSAGQIADSTLRLDYIFDGCAGQPEVSLAAAWTLDKWHGRRNNMDRLPLEGNGQVTVITMSGDTLYRTSFSSLYSEWLSTGDTVRRAFQHTVLVPRPRCEAVVELTLTDARRQVMASHRYVFSPADILVMPKHDSRYDTKELHCGTWPGRKIKVALLPEGFSAAGMDKFDSLANVAVQQILAHEPFTTLGDRFDFVAVHVPSHDDGVTVPHRGEWRDTSFGSHFSTFYSDRYLTTPNVFAVHDALAGVPYEHIIILANCDEYGGGGIYNSYTLTTAGHPDFKPVVVHEFGHSFGGLADEYFYDDDVMTDTYPSDVEPWEPNVTTLVDFSAKWADLLAPGTPVPTPVDAASLYDVGVFEGAAYSSKGIYRPADNCRMRINNIDHFCPACVAAMARLIIFYTE